MILAGFAAESLFTVGLTGTSGLIKELLIIPGIMTKLSVTAAM